MNRTFAIVLVSVFVGLGVLYLTVSAPDPAPVPAKVESADAAMAKDANAVLKRLSERVESLEAEVARLKSVGRRPMARRALAPSRGQKKTAAEPATDSANADDGTRENLATAVARENSPVRREVTQIVRDEFANMRGEWREMRRARHEARDEERVEKVADSADLDDDQINQMSDLLAQERKRVTGVFRSARDTYDFRGAREKVGEMRKETDQALVEVLDEKQLELWKEDRAQRRSRRPW